MYPHCCRALCAPGARRRGRRLPAAGPHRVCAIFPRTVACSPGCPRAAFQGAGSSARPPRNPPRRRRARASGRDPRMLRTGRRSSPLSVIPAGIGGARQHAAGDECCVKRLHTRRSTERWGRGSRTCSLGRCRVGPRAGRERGSPAAGPGNRSGRAPSSRTSGSRRSPSRGWPSEREEEPQVPARAADKIEDIEGGRPLDGADIFARFCASALFRVPSQKREALASYATERPVRVPFPGRSGVWHEAPQGRSLRPTPELMRR